MDATQERPAPDWEQIEADYRAGLLSLRAIAAKDGHVTEGAIRKKALKLEWARDLEARIRARAEEMVRTKLVRSVGTQYATSSEAAETAIVDDNAGFLANVELSQRRDISRARAHVATLNAELESMEGALPIRAGTAKALADAQRILVTLERSVWHMDRMDDGQGASLTNGRLIDSSKLTSDERQQLREIMTRALEREDEDGSDASVICVQNSGQLARR